VALLGEDLRGNVVGRAAQGLLSLALVLDPRGQTEISDFHVQQVIEKEVSQLQITMDDAVIVQVLYALDDLVNVVAALELRDTFPTLVQLHHGLQIEEVSH